MLDLFLLFLSGYSDRSNSLVDLILILILVLFADLFLVLRLAHLLEDLRIGGILAKLLAVKEPVVGEQRVLDVAVARVAPEGEVGEREGDVVVEVLHPVIYHVAFHVSAAPHSAAARLEADPVLATVVAVWAQVIHCDTFELGGR